MRTAIFIISMAALVLALANAALGPGTRIGLWEYGTALGWMRALAMPTLVAAGLAMIGFLLSLWKVRSLTLLALVALIASAAAGYVPLKMRALFQANPFIHDITTDFENPPKIVAAASAPRKNPPEYEGDEQVRNSELTVREAQMEAFPDIGPLLLAADVISAATAARKILGDLGMEILADNDTGNGEVTIEAVATSFWYGFKDDFVVRLTSLETGDVRIDVRSKSRVGLSDLGANARRVRAFLSKLQAEVA